MCFAPSKGEPQEGTKIVADQKSTAMMEVALWQSIQVSVNNFQIHCVIEKSLEPDKKIDTIYNQI